MSHDPHDDFPAHADDDRDWTFPQRFHPTSRLHIDSTHEKPREKYWLHILLFLASIFTTMLAGVGLAAPGFDVFDPANWALGLSYSLLTMTIITAHEFGHYFAARRHGIDASLPYFIPFPIVPFFGATTAAFNPFGTMGAVIRTRTPFLNRRALFDVGVAGPLAGFVMCVIILAVGFLTLPSKEFIYQIHPEYLSEFGGAIPPWGFHFGKIGLYSLFEAIFPFGDSWVPPMNEMYHYPLLCAGWFGLLLTGLNMLPLGQLDGGHVAYAMFGAKVQSLLARVVWWMLLCLGILGMLDALMIGGLLPVDGLEPLAALLASGREWFPWLFPVFPGWIFWALLTRFVIRLDHPFVPEHQPVDRGRRIIGWCAFAVFLLSFAPQGLYDIPEARNAVHEMDSDAIYTELAR